jgi:hypothetical protein
MVYNRACRLDQNTRITMALPVSFMSLTKADNTLKPSGLPETTTITLPVTTLNAGNLAAQTTLISNLIGALGGITIGLATKYEIVVTRSVLGSGPASSPLAQRENKYLLRYHGTTLNQKFQASIGTADLSLLTGNSEFLDMTGTEGAALKTAFEAVVKSPDDGAEAVVLDSVQFVGRNT